MARMTGKCLCGRVRYEANAEPMTTIVCHCDDCQRETGSAFLTGVAVPSDSIKIAGETRTYTQPGGNSGLPMHRVFCANCGSPVMLFKDNTGRVLITAGTLDDRTSIKPDVQLFCEAKQPWVPLAQDIISHPRYYPEREGGS